MFRDPLFGRRGTLASSVVLTALALAQPVALGQPRAPTLCVEATNGCEPAVTQWDYPWYPNFDMRAVPWHTASGGWGPQVRLAAPAAPSTTRAVTVNSRAEFNAAASVAGTRITIATGWAGNTTASITANDIDVIIPRGVSVGAIEIGSYPRNTPISRVRIRGTTPGAYSGGRMGQYRDYSLVTDVIIDGIDMNGDSGYPTFETNAAFRVDSTRVAIVNVRAIAAGPIWLGSAKHVFIGNSNMYHGAATRSAVGYIEGWGIRNTGGPITIVDSRLQGTRYHNLRPQSVGGTGELFYAARNTFVATAEGRTSWTWNNLGNGPWNGQGAIFENNSIYGYAAPGCPFAADLSVNHVTWSRVSNNNFYGAGNVVFNQEYLNRQASAGAGGSGSHDWSTGNTFQTFTQFPAWGGPGDPRQIPLPNGMTVVSGEGQCPSIG